MSIELVMPSNHLILCRSLLFLPSIFHSIRVFSNELALRIRWPNYQSFSISPSNEYSGLISFRIDWFDFLAVQGDPLESSPAQFESISFFLALSLLYGPTLTSVHDYQKDHSFECNDLCQQKSVLSVIKSFTKTQTLLVVYGRCQGEESNGKCHQLRPARQRLHHLRMNKGLGGPGMNRHRE